MGAWDKVKNWFKEDDPQKREQKARDVAQAIDEALPDVVSAKSALALDKERKKRLLEDQLRE